MGPETTKSFTPRDEEVAELLMDIGVKRNVARVLVFLTNNAEATSRDIERGTDLRQPEVSIAMRYLKECDWIDVRESRSESKGRPVKIYNLSRPISEIVDKIEYEKKKEARHQLDLIQKMRECISTQ